MSSLHAPEPEAHQCTGHKQCLLARAPDVLGKQRSDAKAKAVWALTMS